MSSWIPDILGEGFDQRTIELGVDPDGEGAIVATLIRYRPTSSDAAQPAGAPILYVHGYTDYFFQRHIAEHLYAAGHQLYALDLRKCGRSLREDQTPHYISDLSLYDAELERALAIVHEETGRDVVMMAHSTGGLIVPLWLDRRRRNGRRDGVIGEVLNSPWLDLQGSALMRTPLIAAAIEAVGRTRPMTVVPGRSLDTYGSSISAKVHGEWTYNTVSKPLAGFPIRFGWIRAVRRAQAHLHRGINVGVPTLVLRSAVSFHSNEYVPEVDSADAVLDVGQIARWSGCLGDRVSVVPIDGARHDIFLSVAAVREHAFAEMDAWLDDLDAPTPIPAPAAGPAEDGSAGADATPAVTADPSPITEGADSVAADSR